VPLIIEIQDADAQEEGVAVWRLIGRVSPGDLPGSMSHNPELGGREVFQFACLGDYSVLYRSVAGADAEVGPLRTVRSLGQELVARLDPGEKAELWIRTDRMERPARIRFRHEAPQ
jgi:hypothetical protein